MSDSTLFDADPAFVVLCILVLTQGRRRSIGRQVITPEVSWRWSRPLRLTWTWLVESDIRTYA
eukprot:CAMPEP_0167829068 /NCGR_PEP_ID=MMETSP0112_2-20121227/11897_1 /TAXON_ID=91324 /ORGANISM="Lotharella globosa, Strain CCCM811" /LENGTH=62 /DNA_ID=CAMNT_0007732607 /DNA_START=16 /DNA_END=201 /DNA_ORIENTATION=+